MWFVIVGRISCPIFAHVCYVAQYLRDHLPDFHFKREGLNRDEWIEFLKEKNQTLYWNHNISPVIWREVSLRGGKQHYLGSVNEFWEYIYDYYALEYILPREKLERLAKDNGQYFNYKRKRQSVAEDIERKQIRRLCICGASKPALALLIPEIIKNLDLHGVDGVAVYLYSQLHDTQDLLELEEEPDLYDESDTYHIYLQMIDSLPIYLPVLDILILFEGEPRQSHEGYMKWLDKNYRLMEIYANHINEYGKKSLRIIVLSPPVCFNATILIKLLYATRLYNIVAITADIGMEALSVLAGRLDIPISELSCPPVYGFIGLNQLIDIGNIVHRATVYRPNTRAVRTRGGSTLSLGKSTVELRPLVYRTYGLEHFWTEVQARKAKVEEYLGKPTNYAKVRALCNLLRFWYTKQYDGEIISLGVYTSGLYGINSGLVFSQPCVLQHGFWRPFRAFPKPSSDNIPVEYLTTLPLKILECMDENTTTCQFPCICPTDFYRNDDDD